MAITIGSNIASLRAQRQLSLSTDRVATSFERLSSGQRINKASDDAAGLAIAATLDSSIRIYAQGIRNINDGISLTNIAESAVSSLSDIVIRQKELAEQAANGTYSTTQRIALNKEASALTKEYNRIIQSTTFNGVKILDGNDDSVRLQHGIGTAESTVANLGQALGVAAGDGTFGAQVTYAAGGPTSVTAADLNGDGNPDILSADYNSNQVSVRLGRGDGSFGTQATYATGNLPLSVTTGDLNGDGISDLLTADGGAGQVSVRLGRGDGTFGAQATYATGANPFSVSTADLNGDGSLDFLSADLVSNQVSVRLGRGDGTFGAQATYATGTQPTFATTSDLNGDGVTDFLSTDYGSNQVSVRLGKGDGTFGAQATYATGTNPYSVTTADLNNDGITDFVSSDFGSNQVSVRLGKGDGTFGAQATYATGTQPISVSTSDLNGDGIPDILSADFGSNQLSVRLGKGDGTFGAQSTYVTGTNPKSVATADLNGDGIADLLTADYNSNQVSIRLGNADATGRRNNLIAALDLTSIQGARAALTKTTKLLTNISQELGNIGAVQSRLQISASNLAVRVENYAAARSRIMDVDIAQESADLVRGQILQQAGAAILAQANQQPSLALTLLRQ